MRDFANLITNLGYGLVRKRIRDRRDEHAARRTVEA
jgi:hypothetical protein